MEVASRGVTILNPEDQVNPEGIELTNLDKAMGHCKDECSR